MLNYINLLKEVIAAPNRCNYLFYVVAVRFRNSSLQKRKQHVIIKMEKIPIYDKEADCI